MYRLEKLYTFYCVLHSQVQKLMRVEGNEQASSKIISSMEDGSLAILSPVTGEMLSIVYPVNTFQVLRRMNNCTYDWIATFTFVTAHYVFQIYALQCIKFYYTINRLYTTCSIFMKRFP